jgi:hypothetical protein
LQKIPINWIRESKFGGGFHLVGLRPIEITMSTDNVNNICNIVSVLTHEMCHQATCEIDGYNIDDIQKLPDNMTYKIGNDEIDEGHGLHFYIWAQKLCGNN